MGIGTKWWKKIENSSDIKIEKMYSNASSYSKFSRTYNVVDFILEEDKYSLVSNIEENKKLIILRSFTKLFAIAGLRLGYTISSDRFFLKSMDLLNPHWNINTLALRVADLAADIYN